MTNFALRCNNCRTIIVTDPPIKGSCQCGRVATDGNGGICVTYDSRASFTAVVDNDGRWVEADNDNSAP